MRCKKSIAITLALFFIFSFSGNIVPFESELSMPALSTANQEKCLVPDGRSIGVMLSTNGALIVDFMDIDSSNGEVPSPARVAGLKAGDLIQGFDGKKISNVAELVSAIAASAGKSSALTLSRNGKKSEVLIKPEVSKNDGSLKIGAWVKDAASGIGTLTFFDPDTKAFAALGHGICDAETGKLLPVESGSILSAGIVSVSKGEKGVPGELNGIFKNDSETLGEISKNSEAGISGIASKSFAANGTPIPIGHRENVKVGSASVLTTINGSLPQKFDIEIIKIMPKVISQQKGFVIQITDEKLLEKTGGIVQGMSGSPILQNGRIVGAVTHVFVNDPTRGYGIFIEDMLSITAR